MIKAAFFDVDGTLLSHKTKQVPESAVRALEKLKRQGICCIVATGRQIGEMDKLPMGNVTFDGYITMNGQLTMDENRKVLYGMPLEGDVKDYVLKLFREKQMPVILVEQGRIYVNRNCQRVTEVQTSISSKVPPEGDYEGAPLYQACVYITEEERQVLGPVEGKCVVTRWHPGGVDIIAKGGGKRTAVQRYCALQGWKPEETIAFGDSENDLEMLQFAGIGVAMGNAGPEVKAAADYVTADIDEDGIAKALKFFGIL